MPACPVCENERAAGDACAVCAGASAAAPRDGVAIGPGAAASIRGPHRETHLARLRRWLRDRGSGADRPALPPLRKPTRDRVAPVRRGALGAWWSARHARIGAEEFLRHRLAGYLARVPVAPDRLPVTFSVGPLEVVTRSRPEQPPAEWFTSYLRANGAPALQPDLDRAQAEVARLSAELQRCDERLAAARRELEGAAGVPSIGCVDETGVEGLGRPPVPLPWSAVICVLASGLLVAEVSLLALPMLDAAGVSARDLAGEPSRHGAAALLPLLLALGASVSLFVFADVAYRRARVLVEEAPARWRTFWNLATAGSALVAAATVAWSIVGARSSTLERARATSFLVALAVPVATSSLLGLARRLHAVRAKASRAARAWHDAHRLAVARWSRHATALAAEERDRARLQAERATAARWAAELRHRVAQVERLALEEADAESRELQRMCRAIASALELDRCLFLRHAPAHLAPVDPAPGDRPRDPERQLEWTG